jgi:hypothetical protein
MPPPDDSGPSVDDLLGAAQGSSHGSAKPNGSGSHPEAPEADSGEKLRRAKEKLGVWNAGDDDYVIPPRGWLLGTTFCRGFLSSVLADGGVGKTALRVAQLISLAIGRTLTGEHIFQRCRVLIVSLEDSKDELRRRVYAVMRHYAIAPAELDGWLFLAAPKGLRIAEMSKDGAPVAAELETLLRTIVKGEHIDIVTLDPFVKTHSLTENSNDAIDFVCTLLASIGIDYDCAVDFPHHTSKGIGIAGDADKGRGASSGKDAARLVFTLTVMTPDEAKQFNVDEAERKSLVRLDSAKVNIAPPSQKATWFKIVGVHLDNGNAIYIHGDTVQTVERWQPPEAWEGLDSPRLNRILDDIEAGMPNGHRYSSAAPAKERAAWKVVITHAPDKSEKQGRQIINVWVKNGTLYEEPYHDPDRRTVVSGLRVNATLRPS